MIFQHNNLKATEWMGIRRELAKALQKVDDDMAKNGDNTYISGSIKMQIVQTGIFASAVKVVEFWDPDFASTSAPVVEATDPQTPTSEPVTKSTGGKHDMTLTHGLSAQAYYHAKRQSFKRKHGLEPLLSGPLAILSFPTVSPQHLKAALSILSPSPPNFRLRDGKQILRTMSRLCRMDCRSSFCWRRGWRVRCSTRKARNGLVVSTAAWMG